MNPVPPHPLVAAAIAARMAAGLGIRVVFNDGSPDFTAYCRDTAERDRKISSFRKMSIVSSVAVIEAT